MKKVFLLIARLSLAGWVGAAALYVVTSVHEQTSPDVESRMRDVLALIRFPDYYAFGFSMNVVGLVFGALALTGIRRGIFLVLMLLAVAAMTYDYFQVYQPLAALITPPGQTRTEEFTRLHNLSKYINEAGVTLSFLSALLIGWPSSNESSPS